MYQAYVNCGDGVMISVHKIVAIYPAVDDVEYTVKVFSWKKPKAIIYTTDGQILPAYRAPDILARRWQRAIERT